MTRKILSLCFCCIFTAAQTAFAFDFNPPVFVRPIVPSNIVSLPILGQPSPLSMSNYPLYDNVGNRKALTVTRPAAVQQYSYIYNNIYELSQVTGSQSHTYQYDLVGNRLNHNGTVYVPNNLNQYSLVGAQTFSYDTNGNLTDDGTNTYTYDAENRLSAISNQQSAISLQLRRF